MCNRINCSYLCTDWDQCFVVTSSLWLQVVWTLVYLFVDSVCCLWRLWNTNTSMLKSNCRLLVILKNTLCMSYESWSCCHCSSLEYRNGKFICHASLALFPVIKHMMWELEFNGVLWRSMETVTFPTPIFTHCKDQRLEAGRPGNDAMM